MNRRQVLIILIPTFLFVVFWIIFSIYHSIVTSTISENVDMQITPISPNFDTKTIENLKKREKATPIYEISGTSLNVPSAPSPIPISTSSANNASPGGNLIE